MSEKVFDDRANALRDAQASIKVADAKVKTAELDLFFTKITAPVTGRISRSAVTAGSWISAGALANATLLTSIVSEDPIHLYFDISENNWIKYRRMIEAGQKEGAAQLGTQVQVGASRRDRLPAQGQGRLHRQPPRSGDRHDARPAPSSTTRRATFSAGMFARVRVQGSEDYQAIMLPDEAIGTDQTNKFVFTVAEDGTVARKRSSLGPMIDGLRVIRTGVAAADLDHHQGPSARTPRRQSLAEGRADHSVGCGVDHVGGSRWPRPQGVAKRRPRRPPPVSSRSA